MSLWMLQTETSHLWKVRYAIILLDWQYFIILSPVSPIISLVFITLVIFLTYMRLKLYTYLDKSFIYYFSKKISLLYYYTFFNIVNMLWYTFLRHLVEGPGIKKGKAVKVNLGIVLFDKNIWSSIGRVWVDGWGIISNEIKI